MLEPTNAKIESTPNFHKEVIIPQIYDLQNIKLIQSYGFQESPVNKVAALKKQRIEKVIQSIISKQKPQLPLAPLHYSLSKGPLKKVIKYPHEQLLQQLAEQNLFMEIDEHLGELLTLGEENYAPFAERIRSVLRKARFSSAKKEIAEKRKECNFFINTICSKGKKVNPSLIRPVTGLIQELEVLSKPTTSRSARALSARASTSLSKHSQPKQRRSSSNIKTKKGLNTQISKSQKVIASINQCLQSESISNKETLVIMRQMKEEWGIEGQLNKTLFKSHMKITPSTLELLKEKRLKKQSLARMDQQFLNQ